MSAILWPLLLRDLGENGFDLWNADVKDFGPFIVPSGAVQRTQYIEEA